MKQWTKLGGRLLAFALVLCMGASLLPVAPVLAQEDSAAQSAVETEQAAAQEGTAGESNSDDTTGGDVPADVAVSGEIAAENSAEPDGSLTEDESAAEETPTDETEEADNDVAPTEDDAFQLEVTFAGQTLQEKTTNAIASQWDVTTAQSLQVTLKRDTTVELEDSENQQYVLCLKTTEDFYFTALPEIDKIEGAEEMEFVQNTAAGGTELDPYSGELRIRVNPDAETVNLGVLGVKVSDSAAAAVGTTGLTVYSPVSVQLVTADASLKLKDIKDSDKTKVHGYSVDTAKLVNPAAVVATTEPSGDEDTTTDEEETVEPRAVDEENAFSVKVTFADKELSETESNDITDVWPNKGSRIMNVVIERNTAVEVDPDKQYVLCMKTSDVFYFNGLPDVSKINGAEDVTIVRNSTPVVNKPDGVSGALSDFSKYSGEIRIKLNPSVNTVTIPDVAVSYDIKLLGFNGGSLTVDDPVAVSLVSVDSGEALDGFTTAKSLHSAKVDSVVMSSGSLASANWKSAMSIDLFQNTILAQDATLGTDGNISYYFGTNGIESQVYRSLTVVFHCPYVTVDGKDYYLDFASDDIALSENRQGNAKGFKMDENAVYNEADHTITYKFKNLYLGGHHALIYSPSFTWPSALSDRVLQAGESYKIKGVSINITEQTGYLGNVSTLKTSSDQGNTATFIPSQVNIKMTSSAANSGGGLAKRYIYQGITRDNVSTGALGFFDIHNEGSADSPLVEIKYDFNTANTGATYYVTRVNLAADGTTGGTDVDFVLTNGKEGQDISGTRHYGNNSSFNCLVEDLRSSCGADSSYYIKSISYKTKLAKGKKYHAETAHMNRNRIADSGLFFGYLEGELNTTASATMTITALDDSALTTNGDTKLTSTEVSTVSDEDYIGFGIYSASIGGGTSQSITAGGSVTLSFNGVVSTEEYHFTGTSSNRVNGYHVLRDGIFYICLPVGVSIAGVNQVRIKSNDEKVEAKSVKTIGDTFQVGDVTAQWWEIDAPGLNTQSGKNVNVSVDLYTAEEMAGVTWNFSHCVGIRANGQPISWSAAYTTANVYNNASALTGADTLKSLGTYLTSQNDTTDLGIEMLNANANVRLTIARAEAKLDVSTALYTTEAASKNDTVTISNADTDITYAVTVSCAEQGEAKNFNYYIPIVRTDSTLDTGALVSQNEFGLKLTKAVTITRIDSTSESDNDPFEVYYTTDKNLNSTSIQGDSVNWEKEPVDFSKVTAVRIATTANASVKEKEAYRFDVVMQYDNGNNDFERQAGSLDQWRSFGHYSYTRNNATTINSYPSDDNAVRIRYVSDLRKNPMTLTLDTSAATNKIDTSQLLPVTFAKDQKLVIKKVTTTNGTTLITGDPSKLTGAEANGNFHMSFNLSNMTATTLPSVGTGWTITADSQINLQAEVQFSTALTDVITERYVDIELGNDDIDIMCRVVLERKVTAATAKNSGVAEGEQFIVPNVTSSCSISRDSSFTALYVVENFVPGNYSNQVLKWQNSAGQQASFPAGTTITMMEISADNAVTSYWYYKPNGSDVDLNQFVRMAGKATYSYDTSTTTPTTLRYMFVVNFGQAQAAAGSYKLVLDADAKTGVAAFTPVKLDVTLGATKSYSLAASSTADVQKPTATVDYTVNEAAGNDSYSERRSLSLVLSAKDRGTLPQDAQIVVGDTTYSCNGTDHIIIPIGTVASGQKVLTLKSQMFPEKETSYTFDAVLYLSKSRQDTAPMNGNQAARCEITFTKSKESRPALSVTGTRVAEQADWIKGQNIDIQMQNLDGCTVTVTAYSGVNGTTPKTDLLSNVSGIFDFANGTGTYNGKTPTNTLILSSAAKPGTYRLSFEVTKDGETVMTVPYYIIVR